MSFEAECVCPAGDICGEGAAWDPERRVLYWTDINRFLLHRYNPRTCATESWSFSEPVVAVNLTTTVDTLLLVLAERVVLWSPETHPDTQTIYRLPTAPSMRFNDAKVDPRGSLWVGTMRNNVGPQGEDIDVEFTEGVLYRIDPDRTFSEWMHGIGISNTLAWSPDRTKFYFGDSLANAIYEFDYDFATGAIANRRSFFANSKTGLPDGSAMDSEGCLWNTRPLAGCLAKIRPDGSVERIVKIPALKPTTCAFGGDDMRTLFVTSARSNDRLSGSVFSLQIDVPGVPIQRYCV